MYTGVIEHPQNKMSASSSSSFSLHSYNGDSSLFYAGHARELDRFDSYKVKKDYGIKKTIESRAKRINLDNITKWTNHTVREDDKLDDFVEHFISEFTSENLELLPHQKTCISWLSQRIGWKSCDHLFRKYGEWTSHFLPSFSFTGVAIPVEGQGRKEDRYPRKQRYVMDSKDNVGVTGPSKSYTVNFNGLPQGHQQQMGGANDIIVAVPSRYSSIGVFSRDYTPARITSHAASPPWVPYPHRGEPFPQKMEKGIIEGQNPIPVYLCSIPTGLGKTNIGLAYACLKAHLRQNMAQQKRSSSKMSRVHSGNMHGYETSGHVFPQDMLTVPGPDMLHPATWDSLLGTAEVPPPISRREVLPSSSSSASPPTYPWTDCCFRGGVLVVVPPGGTYSMWQQMQRQWFPRLSVQPWGKSGFGSHKALEDFLQADIVLIDKLTFCQRFEEVCKRPASALRPGTWLKWLYIPEVLRKENWKHVEYVMVYVERECIHETEAPAINVKAFIKLHDWYTHLVDPSTLETLFANYQQSELHTTQQAENLIHDEVQRITEGGDAQILISRRRIFILSGGVSTSRAWQEFDKCYHLDTPAIDYQMLCEQMPTHRRLLHNVSWSGIVIDEAHKWSEKYLKGLKYLRADEILLLSASMKVKKIKEIHPVAPSLHQLYLYMYTKTLPATRKNECGELTSRSTMQYAKNHHVFHLSKEQKYEDTWRYLFQGSQAHCVSSSSLEDKQQSDSCSRTITMSGIREDNRNTAGHNTMECTWTIVPMENDELVRWLYQEGLKFLSHLGALTSSQHQTWDPHGHAGKVLRLVYTATTTGVVPQKAIDYIKSLPQLSTYRRRLEQKEKREADRALRERRSTNVPTSSSPVDQLMHKLNANHPNFHDDQSSVSSSIPLDQLFVYPSWHSRESQLMNYDDQNCHECHRIIRHIRAKLSDSSVLKSLEPSMVRVNPHTWDSAVPVLETTVESGHVSFNFAENRRKTIHKALHSPPPTGLFSDMCDEGQLVVARKNKFNIARITSTISWEAVKHAHPMWTQQKDEHLLCILCGSTEVCASGNLISSDEQVWIIQPVILPCGHIFCAGCLQLMFNFQSTYACPACRAPFRTGALKRVTGMPHTVDDWFDRLVQARHGNHQKTHHPPTIHSSAGTSSCSSSTVSSMTTTTTSRAQQVSRFSVSDTQTTMQNAISDLRHLCTVAGGHTPTEHAPLSYPSVIQMADLVSSSRGSTGSGPTVPKKRSRSQQSKKSTSKDGSAPNSPRAQKFTYKAQAAAKIVNEQVKAHEKTLVFVSSVRSATYLRRALRQLVQDIHVNVLTKSVKCADRGQVIEEFSNKTTSSAESAAEVPASPVHGAGSTPTKKVLIVQYSSGGMGVNLQTANHVLVMEPCVGEATQQQAIGRVWRLGQMDNIHVHVIASMGTIDHVALRRYARMGFKSPILSEEMFGPSLSQALVKELPEQFRLDTDTASTTASVTASSTTSTPDVASAMSPPTTGSASVTATASSSC
jgi:hypothetical protein